RHGQGRGAGGADPRNTHGRSGARFRAPLGLVMGPIPPLALAALLVAQGGGEARQNVVLTGMTATPIGAGTWLDPTEDYPVRARRNEEGGTVVARLFVTGVG